MGLLASLRQVPKTKVLVLGGMVCDLVGGGKVARHAAIHERLFHILALDPLELSFTQ